MADSTDGKNASVLAGQNRQDNEGRVVPRMASADSAAADGFINELLHRFWAAGAAVAAAQRPGNQPRLDVERPLEAIYEIMCHVRPDPVEGQKPTSSNAGVCTPAIEASRRSIAVLVGSVLCDCFKPATLEACVELLWLADQEKIAPEDFRRFVRAREVGRMAVSAMLADLASTYPEADAGPPRRPAEGRRRRCGLLP
jgi:hypothetical protein